MFFLKLIYTFEDKSIGNISLASAAGSVRMKLRNFELWPKHLISSPDIVEEYLYKIYTTVYTRIFNLLKWRGVDETEAVRPCISNLFLDVIWNLKLANALFVKLKVTKDWNKCPAETAAHSNFCLNVSN